MSTDPLFKVVTTDGVLVADNKGDGFGKGPASEDCDRRNRAAEKLELKARYKVVAFGGES